MSLIRDRGECVSPRCRRKNPPGATETTHTKSNANGGASIGLLLSLFFGACRGGGVAFAGDWELTLLGRVEIQLLDLDQEEESMDGAGKHNEHGAG